MCNLAHILDVILNHFRLMLFNTWHCTRYILLCWIQKFSDSVWHWTMNSAISEWVQQVILHTWVHLFENMTHQCGQYNFLSFNFESMVSPITEWICHSINECNLQMSYCLLYSSSLERLGRQLVSYELFLRKKARIIYLFEWIFKVQ